MAQKAPGMRGKNTNSSRASGNAYTRLRPASRTAERLLKSGGDAEPAEAVAALEGAYATTANAAQHSHSCNRYRGARMQALAIQARGEQQE